MEEIDGIVDFQSGDCRWAGKAEVAWAAMAFAEPAGHGLKIDPSKWLTRVEPEHELTLYLDWQTRDAELGLNLVDDRKFDLLKSTVTLRGGLDRRMRSASIARTRYQALETINDSEPNSALKYPESVFDDLRAEISKLVLDATYLYTISSRVESLHSFLTQLIGAQGRAFSPEMEQRLRLLGQSWRGLMRVRAWSDRASRSNRPKVTITPFQPDYMNFSGCVISIPGFEGSIAFTEDAAAYLIAQLETISALAHETQSRLGEPSNPRDDWHPTLALVRAIAEFFYFCNFELPFAHGHLALDSVVVDKVWKYENEWIAETDDRSSVRALKRVSAEVASILIKRRKLLECQTEAQLAEFLTCEIPKQSAAPARMLYQSYLSVGLAGFEFDEIDQRIHFHTPPEPVGELIAALLADQPHLANIASSALGGPLETLIGMALLDEKAFGGPLHLDSMCRCEQLARFWRGIGRRRAILMLGDGYVEAVSSALSSLGQPGPEHPTFFTVRVGSAGAETSLDVFSSLVLADQVRLIELLNITWSFGEKFLGKLGQSEDPIQAIPAISSLAAEFEKDLRLRINEGWLVSLDRVWSLLRNSAPVVWDFWSKLKSEEDWQQPILTASASDAAGLLLRLFADCLRLIMLVEMSGLMILTRLRATSDIGTRMLYRIFRPFQARDPERAGSIAQAVDFYFDTEIHFDPALAFAGAFRNYLARTAEDLKALGADKKQCALFDELIRQLNQNYGLGE